MSNKKNKQEPILAKSELDNLSEADAEAMFSGASVEEAMNEAFGPEEAPEFKPKEESKEVKEEVEETDEEEGSKYSKAELLTVFDTLMFEGKYEENIFITPRISAKYRTRTASEGNSVNLYIDRQNFSTLLTLQNHQILMTLSYALQEYTTTSSLKEDTNHRVPTDPRKAYEKLSKLPEALIEVLSTGLNRFDDKVRQATEEADKSF